MPDVEYHGWTHRPKAQGGTDPIEIAAGDDTSYPLVQSLMGPETNDQRYTLSSWGLLFQEDESITYNPATYDPTIYGTWLAESQNDNAVYYRAARLGPKGAVFAFNIIADVDADCGIIGISLARDSENDADGFGPTVPDGYLQDPSSPTYYPLAERPTDGGYTDGLDLYDASPLTRQFGETFEFRIMGDPGDALTGITRADAGGNDGYNDVNLVNGGPGVYWIKFETIGKNASSSGYRIPMRGFYVVRQVASFYGIST